MCHGRPCAAVLRFAKRVHASQNLNSEQIAVADGLARDAGLHTAQFRLGGVYEPGLEPGGVDMSYSRWLMVHLNKPVEAMRAICTLLKPGGVMVCEEADVSAVYAEPSSPAYVELRELCLEGGRGRSAGRICRRHREEERGSRFRCVSRNLRIAP